MNARPLLRRTGVLALLCSTILALAPACAQAEDVATTPIELAVFDFELEDYSAGATIAPTPVADDAYLKKVSAEARRLIEASGHYHLVDVSNSNAEAVKNHSARACNGCKAEVALAQGAQQLLFGVVRRLTRTEFSARFEIRDARSGAILGVRESDMLMGADYAWSRAVARLIKEWLLDVSR
jgi:hypothetical protein